MSDLLDEDLTELKLHIIKCPSCGAEDAELIEFRTGHVVRCDACGLLELTRQDQEHRPDSQPGSDPYTPH
jgi:hypothetical protein